MLQVHVWPDLLAACMRAQMAALIRQLYKWGYAYVENLTWVQMAPNNRVVAAPAPYARRAHLTLFIFRRAGACLAAVAALQHRHALHELLL
jgi:hypothetical protein